ncbi:VWA domain-containing protein [Spirochaetota bacterium]
MLHFASPYFIWLLVLIPALVIFYIFSYYKKKKDISQIGDTAVIQRLTRNINPLKRFIKIVLLFLAIFLLVITLMQPQWGTRLTTMKRKGIDIVFVLDVSRSMLAEDIKPSRLEKAKSEIITFLNNLRGDRVGLVIFAGSSFVSCPLTLDYNALQMFVDIVGPEMVEKQGTVIGFALQNAIRCFDQKERKHKAIILLTDGEDHDSEPLEAAKYSKREGIRVYTIGIGKRLGEVIPIKDANGVISGYLKDRSGNVVISKLDEVMLQKIALATSGKYFHSRYGNLELEKIYSDIQKMEKKELASKKLKQYEERYQIFIFIIIIILIIEFILSDKSKRTFMETGRYE